MKSSARQLLFLAGTAAIGLAAPANAGDLDPRGSHGPVFSAPAQHVNSPPPADAARFCRASAFDCGVRAFDDHGVGASVVWFERAAAEGSVDAMRALGLIYLRGEGGARQDAEEAMAWFFQAAQRGDGESMYVLARAFEAGIGVEPDARLARGWLELSAGAGYRPARRALER